MKHLILVITFFISCAFTPKANPNAHLASVWSEPQGEMHWDDGVARCQSRGMRLPTLEEMRTAYRAGLTRAWIKERPYFWLIEEYPNDSALMMYIVNLGVADTKKKVGSGNQVICIRGESELSAQSNIQSTGASQNWSEYLGRMNWESAYALCASLKMHLPTVKELVKAYDTGEGKSWLLDGAIYWSSDDAPKKDRFLRAYDVNMLNGDSESFYKTSTSLNNVRCAR